MAEESNISMIKSTVLLFSKHLLSQLLCTPNTQPGEEYSDKEKHSLRQRIETKSLWSNALFN
jgi:hypothetical protein